MKLSVVDSATGETVRTLPEQNNLILDAGLNLVATNTWAALMNNCAAGTGNTPTKDILDGTWAQTGTTITSTGSTYTLTSGDIGKWVGFSTGESAKITAIISDTSATVATSQTVATTPANLFRCNQTGLTTEVKRSNNYPTFTETDGNNSNAIILDQANSRLTLRRTFDFTAEVSGVNYTEVGFSPTATAGANLFSRVLLAGAVTVATGQQLRVQYNLTLTFANIASHPQTTAGGTGWPVQYSIASIASNSSNFTVTTSASHHYVAGGRLTITGAKTPTVAITAASSTSVSFTLTTASAHGWTTGQSFVVEGMTPAGYNGTWTAAAGTTGSTIVVTSTANPGAGTVFGTVRIPNPGTWYDGTWTISSVTSNTITVLSAINPGPAGAAGTVQNNLLIAYYPFFWGVNQYPTTGTGSVTQNQYLFPSTGGNVLAGIFDGPTTLNAAIFTAGLVTPATFATSGLSGLITNWVFRDTQTNAYTAGNFFLDYVNVFNAGSANSANIKTLGIVGSTSVTPTMSDKSALQLFVQFDQPQIKTSTNKLTVTLRKSWGRVLS